jgi:hypothetical protein
VEARRLAAAGSIGVEPPAPFLQMTGLWLGNTANLVRRGWSKFWHGVSARVRERLARTIGAAMTFGAAPGAVQPAVRAVLDIIGIRPTPEGTQLRGPVVIISQRSNPMFRSWKIR